MSGDDLYKSSDESATEGVLTVAALTAQIKATLEGQFPAVWVSGEISNFSRPQSGHCYFTLKDEEAQIRAVMWRGAAARARVDLHDGLEVICQGSLDVYSPRGSYQLVVQRIEPKGIGALEQALRRLRERLAAEGLFAAAQKRALPRFPRRVAFVTSPTGAAIHDFLEVLRRRWRGVDVLIVPARVQGEGAAFEIAAGIELANRLSATIDVLVVGRGGGSLEDLWAFNEEIVVRAIHGSRIPVISAVGHEIDVTLSDLVADVRALTPSEAAERIAPDVEDVMAWLVRQRQRLELAMRTRVGAARARVDAASNCRSFRRPLERTQLFARQLDELANRARRAVLRRAEIARSQLESRAVQLESLSPRGVLARGYSLTVDAENGRVLREAREATIGQRLRTLLGEGELHSTVNSVEDITDSEGGVPISARQEEA